MTLIKKFLTASLPVALVGVVTPTIASCSCHKNSFNYEYGDHINCLDKGLGDYHKRKDIASAAKNKTYRAAQGQISLNSANSLLTNNLVGGQYAFNDLIASLVITAEESLNLNDWTYTITDNIAKVQFTLKYKDVDISKDAEAIVIKYIKGSDNNNIYLQFGENEPIRSYTFYDCTTIG